MGAFATRGRSSLEAWPLIVVGFFALVALASLLQGMLDFTIPMALGGEPFAFTRMLGSTLGAGSLFAAILLHNFGLALLVPGCGFLAARLETEDKGRRLIAPLLLAASAFAILLGVGVVLTAAPASDRAFALALAAGEGIAVLSLGFAAARELQRFRTRRPDHQGMALALRSLRAPLALSGAGLAALALIETAHLLGF